MRGEKKRRRRVLERESFIVMVMRECWLPWCCWEAREEKGKEKERWTIG